MANVDDFKEEKIRQWIEKKEHVLIKNNKDSAPLWNDIWLIAHTSAPTIPAVGWVICFCY